MKKVSARAEIQPGLKISTRFEVTGLEFSARPNGLKKNHVIAIHFQPGLKEEHGHAH